MASLLTGLLNIRKPTGCTSRDVVNQVARLVGRTKVGHAGTLDPLASGVLVVCVGKATRLIDFVQRMRKTYRTTVRLGARSDTLDAEGRIEPVESPKVPDAAAVRAALAAQVGRIAQVPPQFSALKVQGRRAYDAARAGQPVRLEPRMVTVYRVDLLRLAWPQLELEVECGSGTYIRSIARDVGEALDCGGLVEVLTRTHVGPFGLETALDPARLTAESLPGLLLPPASAVAELPRLVLSEGELAEVLQGKALDPSAQLANVPAGGEVALFGPDGILAAIAESLPPAGRLQPRRVLAEA